MKNINHDTFLHDLDSGLIHGQLSKKCKGPYNKLTELFRDALGYHAPIKQTFVSGNPATFMANELRKAIMSKSKTKNIKWCSSDDFSAFKKQKTNAIQ